MQAIYNTTNAMEWRNTNTNINTNTNTSTNKDNASNLEHSGEKAQIKTEEEEGGSDALLSVTGVGATVNTESSSHLLFNFYQPASPLCSC